VFQNCLPALAVNTIPKIVWCVREMLLALPDDFWNGVDSAASAGKQFWNTARR